MNALQGFSPLSALKLAIQDEQSARFGRSDLLTDEILNRAHKAASEELRRVIRKMKQDRNQHGVASLER